MESRPTVATRSGIEDGFVEVIWITFWIRVRVGDAFKVDVSNSADNASVSGPKPRFSNRRLRSALARRVGLKVCLASIPTRERPRCWSGLQNNRAESACDTVREDHESRRPESVSPLSMTRRLAELGLECRPGEPSDSSERVCPRSETRRNTTNLRPTIASVDLLDEAEQETSPGRHPQPMKLHEQLVDRRPRPSRHVAGPREQTHLHRESAQSVRAVPDPSIHSRPHLSLRARRDVKVGLLVWLTCCLSLRSSRYQSEALAREESKPSLTSDWCEHSLARRACICVLVRFWTFGYVFSTIASGKSLLAQFPKYLKIRRIVGFCDLNFTNRSQYQS